MLVVRSGSFDEEKELAANGQKSAKGNQITASQMDGCHWSLRMRLVRVAALLLSSNQELVSLPALNSLNFLLNFTCLQLTDILRS